MRKSISRIKDKNDEKRERGGGKEENRLRKIGKKNL